MQYSSCQNVIAVSLVHEHSQLNDFDRCCRVHFETWCNRFSVSVKVTISHLGSLHFGSVLFSLRFPNGSFEMHSKLDFSHLSQRRWCPSRPSAPRGRPSAGTYDAPLSPLGDGARKRPEWANPSLLEPSRLGPTAVLLGHRLVSRLLLLLLGGTTEEANSACEGIGDFLRVGHLHRPAKSPTGIQGKRTDALCRAAQWLKSSLRNCLIIPGKSRCGRPRGVRKDPKAPFRRLSCPQMRALKGTLTIYQTVS